jgi:hypothetical protein
MWCFLGHKLLRTWPRLARLVSSASLYPAEVLTYCPMPTFLYGFKPSWNASLYSDEVPTYHPMPTFLYGLKPSWSASLISDGVPTYHPMPTFLYGFKPSSDTKERAFICLFRTLEPWNLYYGDSPIPPSPDSLKASTGGPQRHHSQHAEKTEKKRKTPEAVKALPTSIKGKETFWPSAPPFTACRSSWWRKRHACASSWRSQSFYLALSSYRSNSWC